MDSGALRQLHGVVRQPASTVGNVDGCPGVVILGAGFSRAVNDHMPLTDELGRKAVRLAGLEGDPRVPEFGQGFTFEEWLSLLADDQPQLSEAANKANGALFARLKESLAEVLTSGELSSG